MLHANLKSLALTQLSLKDILAPEAYADFMTVFKQTVLRINETGYKPPTSAPLQSLWSEIGEACQKVVADSFDIVYSDR